MNTPSLRRRTNHRKHTALKPLVKASLNGERSTADGQRLTVNG
jgi:hypothetical protein